MLVNFDNLYYDIVAKEFCYKETDDRILTSRRITIVHKLPFDNVVNIDTVMALPGDSKQYTSTSPNDLIKLEEGFNILIQPSKVLAKYNGKIDDIMTIIKLSEFIDITKDSDKRRRLGQLSEEINRCTNIFNNWWMRTSINPSRTVVEPIDNSLYFDIDSRDNVALVRFPINEQDSKYIMFSRAIVNSVDDFDNIDQILCNCFQNKTPMTIHFINQNRFVSGDISRIFDSEDDANEAIDKSNLIYIGNINDKHILDTLDVMDMWLLRHYG